MVHYVFTPWRDRQELLAVRRQFYPNLDHVRPRQRQQTSAALQRQAVARVSVWMQRGHCPHMVESTALLVAAVLSDSGTALPASSVVLASSASSARARPPPLPEAVYAARAAYAAAFSRFVTGLLDGHQDRARKLSMYSVARTIGLPAAFVELRHQATHEPLPSRGRLRAAAQHALVWIWHYYWANLGDDEEDAVVAAAAADAAERLDGAHHGACRAALLQYVDTTTTTRTTTTAAAAGKKRRHDADDPGERKELPGTDEAADLDMLAQSVGQWGETLVLSVLADMVARRTDSMDEDDDDDDDDDDDGRSLRRARRCMQLTSLWLRRGSKTAAVEAAAETAETAETESTTAANWTLESLDINAVRAALDQDRQALQALETAADREEAETVNGTGNALNASEPAWTRLEQPVGPPMWSRYGDDWEPKPIGVV